MGGLAGENSVKDNQALRRGDVLYRIDPRPFEMQLAKARATLTSLDREIELTQPSANAQKLGAASATANTERARATAEQAKDTLARTEPLLSTQYVSAEQVDQALSAGAAERRRARCAARHRRHQRRRCAGRETRRIGRAPGG